jgi:hypothetical protein
LSQRKLESRLCVTLADHWMIGSAVEKHFRLALE